MATVADKSGNGGGTTGSGPEDKLSATTRTATAVHGALTPAFVGEIATDLTDGQNYVATGVSANTDWAKTSRG
jgi:hypothetical protein